MRELPSHSKQIQAAPSVVSDLTKLEADLRTRLAGLKSNGANTGTVSMLETQLEAVKAAQEVASVQQDIQASRNKVAAERQIKSRAPSLTPGQKFNTYYGEGGYVEHARANIASLGALIEKNI